MYAQMERRRILHQRLELAITEKLKPELEERIAPLAIEYMPRLRQSPDYSDVPEESLGQLARNFAMRDVVIQDAKWETLDVITPERVTSSLLLLLAAAETLAECSPVLLSEVIPQLKKSHLAPTPALLWLMNAMGVDDAKRHEMCEKESRRRLTDLSDTVRTVAERLDADGGAWTSQFAARKA